MFCFSNDLTLSDIRSDTVSGFQSTEFQADDYLLNHLQSAPLNTHWHIDQRIGARIGSILIGPCKYKMRFKGKPL